MTAVANSRARGRMNIVEPARITSAKPKHDYRPVAIGGVKQEMTTSDGQKVIYYAETTTMKLRDIPNQPNQLGWWLDDVNDGIELIFKYLSPDTLVRAELIEAANPLRARLSEWLDFNRTTQYRITRAGGNLGVEEGANIREEAAALMRDAEMMYEGVAILVTLSPLLVLTKEEEGDGRLWVKRIPFLRLYQLWVFLTSELARVEEYFRNARRAL